MKCKVSRVINNITINGNEYLLDRDNEVIVFISTKYAKEYLKSHGITNFEGFNFEKVRK